MAAGRARGWTGGNDADPGVTVLEVLAYAVAAAAGALAVAVARRRRCRGRR